MMMMMILSVGSDIGIGIIIGIGMERPIIY